MSRDINPGDKIESALHYKIKLVIVSDRLVDMANMVIGQFLSEIKIR